MEPIIKTATINCAYLTIVYYVDGQGIIHKLEYLTATYDIEDERIEYVYEYSINPDPYDTDGTVIIIGYEMEEMLDNVNKHYAKDMERALELQTKKVEENRKAAESRESEAKARRLKAFEELKKEFEAE